MTSRCFLRSNLLDMTSNSRALFRRILRKRRSALPTDVQDAHALAVCRHLIASGLFEQIRQVACYLATDGELDLKPTIEHLKHRGIDVLLPVVANKSMWFTVFQDSAGLEMNQFGIHEPIDKTERALHLEDLILAPLVGFTLQGERLGRGGGYYDKFLQNNRQTLVVGVAHSIQQMDQFESRPHDIPLDGLVTENGVCSFRDAARQRLVGTDTA